MSILFRKCCCLSLRQASLTICNFVLAQELCMFIFLIFNINDRQSNVITPRSETRSSLYFLLWLRVFNVIVVITGLYGIYKERAHLMIPFLAYRTVNLVFMTLDVINLRALADAFNAQYAKMNDNNNKVDFLPVIIVAVLFMIGVELYFLLIVYSYYQSLMQNRNMINVLDVPIVIYTSHPHDEHLIYSQPPSNPYLFPPKSPHQYNFSNQPPPSYAYSTGMNFNKSPTDPLPPPYRS